MAVFAANKTINKSTINCGEEAMVTLSYKATADLINKPSDILLLFDRSDSMTGERFEYAKQGSLDFIEHILKASGGTTKLENNNQLGLITFGFDATIDSDLTDDVNKIKGLINNIVIPAHSKTNHAEAYRLATTIFKNNPPKDQTLVIFTDGETTYGEEPNTYVSKLKKMGVEIYCIGLDIKDFSLLSWASEPKKIHSLTTKDPAKLIEIFNRISYEVSKAGSKDAIIMEKLAKYFEIININNPNFGTITQIDKQTFKWNIDVLGINEEAICTFNIKYIGDVNGEINVNESITYEDRDKNNLIFPNPKIKVRCDKEIDPSTNIEDITIVGCDDLVVHQIIDQNFDELGRIIQVDVPIKNVCPNKKVALSVILTEVNNNLEYKIGMKTILINPIKSDKCENILVKCITFVVPEELYAINKTSICNDRIFKARIMINYIDIDYECCDQNIIVL